MIAGGVFCRKEYVTSKMLPLQKVPHRQEFAHVGSMVEGEARGIWPTPQNLAHEKGGAFERGRDEKREGPGAYPKAKADMIAQNHVVRLLVIQSLPGVPQPAGGLPGPGTPPVELGGLG